jgi:MFS transporter, PPP family, 3-phenylpropionic acid transporter
MESGPKQSFNFSLFLFTHYAHGGTFITYVSLFFAARGMTVPEIGLLISLVQVLRIVGPNLWGWVADHTQQRVRVLRTTLICAAVVFTGFFFGQTFAQFFALMIVLNLFTSAGTPLSEALILSEMRGDLTHYGRIRLWGSIGYIVAVMAASYLLEWYSVEAFPWIIFGMLLLLVAASFRLREVPHAEGAHVSPPLMGVLRKPEVIAFFTATALMVAAHMALYVFYSLYLERAGYSKPVIGAMWSIGVVAEIGFFYYQAAFLRRVGAQRLLMIAFGVAVLRFAVIGAAADWLVLLVLAQLLHAATFAAHHSATLAAMQRWFSGPLQARGQALYISIAYGIGGAGSGVLLSACWDALGPEYVYYAAALLSLLAWGAAALSFRWQGRTARAEFGG